MGVDNTIALPHVAFQFCFISSSMMLRRIAHSVSVIACLSVVLIVILSNRDSKPRYSTNLSLNEFNRGNCSVPWDLIESTYILNETSSLFNCSKEQICDKLFQLDWDRMLLRINSTLIANMTVACSYRPFGLNSAKSDISYSSWSTWDMSKDLPIDKDFIQLKCLSDSQLLCNSVYFGFSSKQNALKPLKKSDYNVVLLVLDGMSEVILKLILNETEKLLSSWSNIYKFRYHHKVGPNSYPNMAAYLTGLDFQEEFSLVKRAQMQSQNDFIWKLFAQNGFKTYYSTDERPLWYLDSYLTREINQHQFDYNWWPFFKHSPDQNWQDQDRCIADTPRIHKQLAHLYQFSKRYMDEQQMFIYFHIAELIHNDPFTKGHLLDKPFVDHLVNWKLSGFLDRTVLFVLGDHGTRYTPERYKDSKAQKLQENLPLLNLVIPESFRLSHPQLMSNLEANQNKLTSQFDVHATLIDLLQRLTNKSLISSKERGVSLFSKIGNRDCTTANIPLQYCACQSNKYKV